MTELYANGTPVTLGLVERRFVAPFAMRVWGSTLSAADADPRSGPSAWSPPV